MGVTGGAAAVKEVHGPKVSLKEAGRGIAAVDTAHWLFNIGTSTSEFANRFHLEPKVTLYDLLFVQLKQRIDICSSFGIQLLFVFDNASNPLKRFEALRRSDERVKSLHLLHTKWIVDDVYDEEEVMLDLMLVIALF